jgi:hypothetical protein
MAVNIGSLTGGTLNTIALAAPLDQATRDVVAQLFQKMATAMPWITYDPVGMSALAMDQQSYPYPVQTIGNPPVWLNTADRLQVWRDIAGQFVPITQQILTGQILQARVVAIALNNNVTFWNNVARYSGVDAINAVWDDLWQAIASFRASRDATKVAFDQTAPIVAQYGAKIPASLTSQRAALIAQFNDLTNRASTTLAPLGAQARTAAGLGIAPLVIAGIAAATVATIAAAVWGIAHEFSAVQINANNNAQAILQARDTADQADFEAGKITNEQLTQRRNDNVTSAAKLVDAEGAGAVGRAVGRAGTGVAIGVGALALALIGGYFLLRKSRSS